MSIAHCDYHRDSVSILSWFIRVRTLPWHCFLSFMVSALLIYSMHLSDSSAQRDFSVGINARSWAHVLPFSLPPRQWLVHSVWWLPPMNLDTKVDSNVYMICDRWPTSCRHSQYGRHWREAGLGLDIHHRGPPYCSGWHSLLLDYPRLSGHCEISNRGRT